MTAKLSIVRVGLGWEVILTFDDMSEQKIILSNIDVDLKLMIYQLIEHPDALVLYVI